MFLTANKTWWGTKRLGTCTPSSKVALIEWCFVTSCECSLANSPLLLFWVQCYFLCSAFCGLSKRILVFFFCCFFFGGQISRPVIWVISVGLHKPNHTYSFCVQKISLCYLPLLISYFLLVIHSNSAAGSQTRGWLYCFIPLSLRQSNWSYILLSGEKSKSTRTGKRRFGMSAAPWQPQ